MTWLLEIILVVVGTVLWFSGPFFARKIPEYASYWTGPDFPGYTAGDAWRLRWSDWFQSLGATLIIGGLVFILLWGVRTFVYYCHWCRYYYEDQYKGVLKLKYLLTRTPVFFRLYFHPKSVIKLSEARFKK